MVKRVFLSTGVLTATCGQPTLISTISMKGKAENRINFVDELQKEI